MATPESVQAVVDTALETWKRQLLDLTRRNRALNFRPLKVSTVAIVDEQPAEVYRLLFDEERTLTFAATPPKPTTGIAPRPDAPAASPEAREDEDPFDDAEHAHESRTFEPYAQDALPDAHRDTVLQTTLEPEALDRSLRRIEEQARLSLEEQGVNTLFLALGLLHYTEAEASDEVFKAPLVLLPVSLRRESARSPFALTVGDDEPMINPALAELLRRQHNLALPELPSGEDASLQTLFREAQASIEKLPVARTEPRWRITNDVYLGLFSFQKLVMYKDLEANAAAVTQHRLVHQLITRRGSVTGGGLGLPDDVRTASLDDEYPPERGAHVVDADGSQQRALAAAERGYDLVVEGPPGTGKSQTITNLVAQALHGGKTVLFVAEKMAALDVVHQRLQQVGLGEFCLELHSTRSSKREVIKSIAAALDASLQHAPTTGDAAAKLPDVRAELGEYAKAVHQRFGAIETTPFSAYGQLAAVLDAPRVDWTADPVPVTQAALDLADARLQALAAAATAAGDISTHPWRDTSRTFYPQDQLDAVVEAATGVAADVAGVEAAARDATAALGLPALESLADLERLRVVADLLRQSPGAPRDVIESADWNTVPREALDLVEKVRTAQRLAVEVSARFLPDVLQGDHTGDIAYIEGKSGVLASLFWWLDGRQRAIRTRWVAQRQPGYVPSFAAQAHDLESVVALRETRAALEAAHGRGTALFGALWQGVESDDAQLEAYGRWVTSLRAVHARTPLSERTMTLAAEGHVDLAAADRLEELATALVTMVERLASLVQWRSDGSTSARAPSDKTALMTLSLAELQARVSGLVSGSHRAARWGAFVAATQEARETIAAPLVELAEANRVGHADLPRALRRAFWFAWLARCVESRPALTRFHALTHEQRVREFRDLDRRVLADNRSRLVASLRARVQTSLRDEAVEAAMPVLRREMAKQRNHRPIRETLRLAALAVRAIKPVFLMSPLSVAQFTQGDTPTFDLVVFDEASQLPPEDAIGSIVRGAQLVVVGDPKQLPPTSFFASTHDVPVVTDSEDGIDVPDAESILETFMGCGVPMSRLKWHYRSAHESLISFSNVSFYDGDLLTFPSVDAVSERLGLRFEHVSGGVYEGKGLNLAEARRVADAVVQFAREQLAGARAGVRPLSLGVGTFNLRQQLAIQDLLEERRRDEPDIELFFDRSRDEPFFVKNLENIQGDERDVIFLSVTYAKARDGRLRQNFGPLNGDNGWRRLNVLTTRARRAMRVFSSMRASDIHEGQSKGGPLLKGFLEYAESGRLDHPSLVAAAQAESPFEREVVTDLTRRGHLVQPQVGVAGYRIDIGVRDPDAPGRFLLGIECDGVAYHASDTARDRDRLRQQVLEARGWTIVRLWSTDWFKDRAGQMERLDQAIADAREANRGRDGSAGPSQPGRHDDSAGWSHDGSAGPTQPGRRDDSAGWSHDGSAGLSQPARHDGSAGLSQPGVAPALRSGHDHDVPTRSVQYTKAPTPASLPAAGVLDCDARTLASIVAHIVGVESPVHEDDLVSRLAGYFGQRAGARIRAHALAACAEAASRGRVERRGEFLWTSGAVCQPRDRSGTGITADRIAPEEYEAAMRAVLARGRSVRRDALMAETRALLGFERTGATLSAALDATIDRLVADGALGEASDGYRLRG